MTERREPIDDGTAAIEADPADVLEQAQPLAGEPAERSIERERNAPFGGQDDDDRLRDDAREAGA